MSKPKLRRLVLSIILTLLLVALGYYSNQSQPKTALNIPAGSYRVVEFADGDTIVIDMDGRNERVRIIGVDTPETHDPRKPVECFGQAASDFTKNLIGSQPVRLEADSLSTNRDRYDRLLRHVYTSDNKLVSAEIIKEGFGFAYLSFPFGKLDEFRTYEQQARQQGKGLWSSCQPYLDKSGYIHTNPA